MSEKAAIYLVITEDSEEADIAMGEDAPGDQVERLAGDLDFSQARKLTEEIVKAYGNDLKAEK